MNLNARPKATRFSVPLSPITLGRLYLAHGPDNNEHGMRALFIRHGCSLTSVEFTPFSGRMTVGSMTLLVTSAGRCSNSLASLGDIVTIGGGFSIPGPLVLIELDGVENLMAAGGFPASTAKQHLGVSLSSVATFRYAARRATLADQVNKAVFHTADWWFGHADPLASWTRGVLRQHKSRLSNEMGLSVDQFEIYAPEIFRDQRKAGRWMRAVQVLRPLDGLRLCRPISNARSFGAMYFLGSFRFYDGSLILSRSTPIAAELTRRLRFGFDAVLGATRQVSIPITTTSFIFDNSVALPESEARVLSLAWRNLQSPTDNSQSYFFHVNALPLVLCALAQLCITPTLINRRQHA